MIADSELKYSVGPLLYTPALNRKIARSVTEGKLDTPYSLSICLEDTIAPDMVPQAEAQLVESVTAIRDAAEKGTCSYLPKLFVRVRSPEQLERVFDSLADCQDVLTGFVFPKYTLSNAEQYNAGMERLNGKAKHTLYMMPILESEDILDPRTRHEVLSGIRDRIDSVRDLVLNVRVGGNDFCNHYAARRHYDETIYDILPIAMLLGDILSFFCRDYVVSGAVWEFFASDNDEWKKGLQRELKLDRLAGFIGKTVIHPKQISVVNDMLKVASKDYEDAKSILNWDESGLLVGRSFAGERMNEPKTHYNWAVRTMLMAELYGVV